MPEQPYLPPFDLIGEQYDDSFTDRTAQLAAGSWVIDQLPAGARVLDLGCGSGLPTAMQFAEAGMRVVGVDESDVMLRLARQRVPHGQFHRRDLRELDELGEFDAAVSFFSLLMVPRVDIAGVLRDLTRRLRGPRLLAISMVYGDFDDFPISFMGVPTKVTAYPTEELVAVVQEAGYQVVQADEVDTEAEPGRTERQIFVRASAG